MLGVVWPHAPNVPTLISSLNNHHVKDKRKGSVVNKQRGLSFSSAAFWQHSHSPATCSFLKPPSSNFRYSLPPPPQCSPHKWAFVPPQTWSFHGQPCPVCSTSPSAQHRAPRPQHTHTTLHYYIILRLHQAPTWSRAPMHHLFFLLLHCLLVIFNWQSKFCSGIHQVHFYQHGL